MTNNVQSIEDLIGATRGQPTDDNDPNVTLASKQEEIKRKVMEKETEKLAKSTGMKYFKLLNFPISLDALTLISEEEAHRLMMVTFLYNGKVLDAVTADPYNQEVKDVFDKLLTAYHCTGTLYLVSSSSLAYALDLYNKLPKKKEVFRGVQINEEEMNRYSDQLSSLKDLQRQIDSADITDIVTIVLAASIKAGASDIHIETEEKSIKVRFRIDGVLHDVVDINKNAWKKIISRMKLLAGVKINIGDKPQDGRVSIQLKDDRVDIRASFLPTAFGESVVMRLLHSKSVGLTFEHLGIRDRFFEQLKKEIERPNGMIITTGPTGSGKTTTLYAILKKLNNEDTKIITIEDPIEYQLAGVNQSQTSEKYTFAQGLRSIVRQDPDIIMVGEIRDLETSEIAIQAALTGHLVLSTIHTNDASGTVPRLLSMGAKPYLIAPAINAMIGQRLVRKICQACKEEAKITAEDIERVKKIFSELPEAEKLAVEKKELKFYRGKGCAICQQIGYKGRIGIYEIMTMTSDVEKLILSGHVSEYDMKEVAVKNGMVTMVQDGVLKALDGITSLDEVFRVAE